ncbi:fibroblast growth factor receptor 4-like isoform X2 [Apostichopus japonicus]|uniref:fibroblast growth factor receptor 4-like isoform X2 n=1 Tax=Stichopus japonicus TaxID=307972 RepID=UPI003AB7001B
MKVLTWTAFILFLHDVVADTPPPSEPETDFLLLVVLPILSVVAIIVVCACLCTISRCRQESRNWDPLVTRVEFRRSIRRGASAIERQIRRLPHRPSEIPNNYSISSQLQSDGEIEYFKAVYATKGGRRTVIARKVSARADVKRAHRFVVAAKKLASLPSHRNVVELLGVSIDKIPSYTFHAYVEGGNLRNYLQKINKQASTSNSKSSRKQQKITQPANYKELMRFAYEVTSAMNFLHKRKFLHPALGARKILLGENNCSKLFDFWPETEAIEIVSNLLPLPNAPIAWLSPESVFLGIYGFEGDVWSIGIFLWELFSFGEEPYKGKTKDQIETKLRQRVQLNRPTYCPGSIYGIIMSAWEKDVEKRPTSNKIIDDLKIFLEKENIANIDDGNYRYYSIDSGEDYDKLDRLNIDVHEDGVIYG